jgi:hypothetical protein
MYATSVQFKHTFGNMLLKNANTVCNNITVIINNKCHYFSKLYFKKHQDVQQEFSLM